VNQTPSLFGTPREWAIDLAVVTAMGVLFGVIGPFGSFYGGPMQLRIADWLANLWIGFVVLSIIVRLAMRAAMRLDLPVWFALGMGVAIGAVPLAIILSYFAAWFWPNNHGHLSPFFDEYGQVLILAEPFSFAYYFLADRGWRGTIARARAEAAQRAAAPNRPPTEAGAGFLDRLPPRLGRDLICLQMEDHYVRAHTAKGSDLILTPLKEAIAELGDVEGMQVHRSWWVARAAVTQTVTDGRGVTLKLSNGLEAPVSRASVARLRAAGWLG
jgi:hypothetical protein